MQDIDNAKDVLYLCVMKNKDELARVKQWFFKVKVRCFLEAKRSDVQLAIDAGLIELNADGTAYDLDAEAEEWAIMHIIEELSEQALRHKMGRNHAAHNAIIGLKNRLMSAFENGLPIPSELDGVLRDYQFCALLTLSKPLHTLYNTSGWEGWDGEYV